MEMFPASTRAKIVIKNPNSLVSGLRVTRQMDGMTTTLI